MDVFRKYQDKVIRPTKDAAEELWQLGNGLANVSEILEIGYTCSSSRRKDNIIEKCITRGSDVYKVVVADCGSYWLLIHFGRFTYKRR